RAAATDKRTFSRLFALLQEIVDGLLLIVGDVDAAEREGASALRRKEPVMLEHDHQLVHFLQIEPKVLQRNDHVEIAFLLLIGQMLVSDFLTQPKFLLDVSAER